MPFLKAFEELARLRVWLFYATNQLPRPAVFLYLKGGRYAQGG